MLPQHLCAYFHVSSFILDIVVRYPEMPCLSLGGLSFHVYPKKVIDNGTNSEQRNKNINIVATSSQLSICLFHIIHSIIPFHKMFNQKRYARFLYFLGIPLIAVFPCSYFRKLTFRKDAQCDGS